MAKRGELSNSINGAEARKKAGDYEWIISIVEERSIAPSHKQLKMVPREFRNKKQNKGYFDPRVVSIGPYHHGKPELKEAEKLKSRAVSAFIAVSNVKPHGIYNKMLEVVSDARKCYIEGSTDSYDDVEFARMMLLDGCFILQVIYSFVYEKGPFLEEMNKLVSRAALRGMLVDFILLENQLPFLVLQALISSTTTSPEEEWEKLIENSIATFLVVNINATALRQETYKREKEQPIHLLDLARRRYIGQCPPPDSSSSEKVHGPPPTKLDDQSRPPCSFKMTIPWWPKRGHGETNPAKDHHNYSFRSATELKARGIHFRRSTTFFLNDFTFSSRFGYGLLTLPQLGFGWRTKYVLLNMMAYELALPLGRNNPEVCNYVYFMNSLINGAEDVIELRSHNIIHNFYGTDEEVAKAFNSMATGTAYLAFKGPIKDVSDRIQDHYNIKMKTWMAQLLHNYFSNPWSAVAFFAATFALVLTFIQTFFPR